MKQTLMCVLTVCVLLDLPLIFSSTTSSNTSQPSSSSSSSSPSSPSTFDLWTYLPSEWRSFCDVDYDVDPDVNATLRCHPVPESPVQWRLADLRNSLNVTFVESTGLEVALHIQCETGANISLPFPFRSPGLVKLTVRNCQLLDKYADFNTTAESLGDWARVVDMQNCVWLNDPAAISRILDNPAHFSSHYDCGQDSTLVKYIYRNISDKDLPDHRNIGDEVQPDPCIEVFLMSFQAVNLTFPDDLAVLVDGDDEVFNVFENYSRQEGGMFEQCAIELSLLRTAADIMTDNPNKKVVDFFTRLNKLHSKCQYEHVQVWDESFSPILTKKHFEYLVKNAVFPELQVLNYSFSGLTEVPRELHDWRIYFAGSQLKVIDLSHSLISEVYRIYPFYNNLGVSTMLDLSFNRISMLSIKMLESWAKVPDFRVDIRGNPIHCTCDMKELIIQLRNESRFASPAMRYYKQQLSELACATPSDLSGVKVASLTLSDLGCLEVDLLAAVIVLVVVVILLLILFFLAVKYNREVRVLMYTRMNILLPCGLHKRRSASMQEKTFDAFVAYAHQDTDWVLNCLLKRLEDPGTAKGRPPCKLCIHQRDFVVGKPIIDNIVDSITSSRHTIVVLTNSFVKSAWAMEELQQAYHQSIEERRRHLVVVMLEEVAQTDMGSILRRCCKTFTYLHVSDTFFWDRLLFSIQVGDDRNDKEQNQLIKEIEPVQADDANKAEDFLNLSLSGESQPDKGNNSDSGKGNSTWETTETGLGFNPKAVFSEAMRFMSVDSTWNAMTTD